MATKKKAATAKKVASKPVRKLAKSTIKHNAALEKAGLTIMDSKERAMGIKEYLINESQFQIINLLKQNEKNHLIVRPLATLLNRFDSNTYTYPSLKASYKDCIKLLNAGLIKKSTGDSYILTAKGNKFGETLKVY